MASIVLGYVAGAHGLRGEVRVQLFHAESEALRKGAHVSLARRASDGSLGEAQVLVVEGVAHSGSIARLALRGIRSREAAEALVRCEVSVPREALPPLGDDEVYLADLVGLRAVQGERELGPIEAVVHHPASDCVRIREAGGIREVPLVPPYLVEIDLRDGVVRFDLVEDFELEGA